MGADSGCDTSLPCVGECKDDNTLLTQIAFTILLVYSFYLLWRNIRNLLHLRDQRKKIRVHKLLIINLVIFVFLICKLPIFENSNILKRISYSMRMALFHYLQRMVSSTLKHLTLWKSSLPALNKSLLLLGTTTGRQKLISSNQRQ